MSDALWLKCGLIGALILIGSACRKPSERASVSATSQSSSPAASASSVASAEAPPPDPLALRRARALEWIELGRREVAKRPGLLIMLAEYAEQLHPAVAMNLIEAAEAQEASAEATDVEDLSTWFAKHGDRKKARLYLEHATDGVGGGWRLAVPRAARRALDGDLESAIDALTNDRDLAKYGGEAPAVKIQNLTDLGHELGWLGAEDTVRKLLPRLDVGGKREAMTSLLGAFVAAKQNSDVERLLPEVDGLLGKTDNRRFDMASAYVALGKLAEAKAVLDAYTDAARSGPPAPDRLSLVPWPHNLDPALAEPLAQLTYDQALARGLRVADYNLAHGLARFDKRLALDVLDKLPVCKTPPFPADLCDFTPGEIARVRALLGEPPWPALDYANSAAKHGGGGVRIDVIGTVAVATMRFPDIPLLPEDEKKLQALLNAAK